MSHLARYLQVEFQRGCPDGWECVPEAPVAVRELEDALGFAPRADLLIRRADGSRRIWVEFEISRADPAANQVKFGVFHLFEPFPSSDAFVSMVSQHVAPGRRNLTIAAAQLLRNSGMTAFQTHLLPGTVGEEIKRLNHSDRATIDLARLDVATERERVLTISEPEGCCEDQSIHLASNLMEVRWSLRNWNREIADPDARRCWGARTVQYFVCDDDSVQFAPSKFCAYTAIPQRPARVAGAGAGSVAIPMRIPLYAEVDQRLRIFDGNRAWRHLTRLLGMTLRPLSSAGEEVRERFERWRRQVDGAVRVHPRGAMLIGFPPWFA